MDIEFIRDSLKNDEILAELTEKLRRFSGMPVQTYACICNAAKVDIEENEICLAVDLDETAVMAYGVKSKPGKMFIHLFSSFDEANKAMKIMLGSENENICWTPVPLMSIVDWDDDEIQKYVSGEHSSDGMVRMLSVINNIDTDRTPPEAIKALKEAYPDGQVPCDIWYDGDPLFPELEAMLARGELYQPDEDSDGCQCPNCIGEKIQKLIEKSGIIPKHGTVKVLHVGEKEGIVEGEIEIKVHGQNPLGASKNRIKDYLQ